MVLKINSIFRKIRTRTLRNKHTTKFKEDVTIGEPDFQAARARLWVFDKNRDVSLKVETNKVDGTAQIEFHNEQTAHQYNIGIEDGGGGTDILSFFSKEAGINLMEFNNNIIVLNSLPTSDPTVTGALWNNSGVVTVSAG